MTEKTEYFKEELVYILNPKIKEFAEKAINTLPDYFFHIPASSTSKYHPQYALGDGGLLRHTRAAIRIAIELARMSWFNFTSDELDLCLASLFIHDGYKSGVIQEKFSRADHPNIIKGELLKNSELNSILPTEYFNIVLQITSRHMGQWNRDYKTQQEILEKPQTKLEKFVHLSDYLASRKCLTMEFDVEVKREINP